MRIRLDFLQHFFAIGFIVCLMIDQIRISAFLNDHQLVAEEAFKNLGSFPSRSTSSSKKSHEIVRQTINKEIRSWGCDRRETPLIFVHIGKAGGGNVRARLWAASLNHTLGTNLLSPNGAYYPLSNTSVARFCNSCSTNHMPSNEPTYEGTTQCHAKTPIGQAIACPDDLRRAERLSFTAQGECGLDSDSCHLVYAGHNFLGAEMHWLPPKYLKKWWRSSWSNPGDQISSLWKKLEPDEIWCDQLSRTRPQHSADYRELYDACSVPLHITADRWAENTVAKRLNHEIIMDWSKLYASLPVLRVIVMRDPFSWLMSKYAWGFRQKKNRVNKKICKNITLSLGYPDHHGARPQILNKDSVAPGWIRRMSLGYLMYLCGEDCFTRYAAGVVSLKDLENQAEGNLRNSFAVVGLLQDTDVFLEMISARVGYIDTSLNSHVKNIDHQSAGNTELMECKKLYSLPSIQQTLVKASPELAAIDRLYKVAVEVNRHQLEELRSCSQLPLGREISRK